MISSRLASAVQLPFLRPRALPFSSTAQAAAVGDHQVDINNVQFKLVLECRNIDANAMNRQLAGMGWSAQNAPGDCSHGSDGGAGYYRHVISPPLTLGGGAEQQLRDVLTRLKSAGAVPGETGALRLYVSDHALNEDGVNNLVNMHLCNENILYRLGQAGAVGRRVTDKQRWAPPLSCGSPYTAYSGFKGFTIGERKTKAQWRTDLANKHWGMNANQNGWWEFRYFDSSMNEQAIADNVRLLLGMVKAACENRGQWTQVHAVGNTFHNQVSRQQWNQLMNAAVGPGDLKKRLEQNFIAAGGQLEKEKMSDAARQALRDAQGQGYGFADQSGQPLDGIDAVSQRVDDEQPLTVRFPGGGNITVTGSEAVDFAFCATGNLTDVSQAVRDRVPTFNDLTGRGVQFTEPGGATLSAAVAAFMGGRDGAVLAGKNGARIVLGSPEHGQLSAAELLAIESQNNAGIPADARLVLDQMPYFRDHGFTLGASQAGAVVPLAADWPAQTAASFRAGNLVLCRDGQQQPVANAPALEAAIYPLKLGDLSPEDRALHDELAALSAQGFRFMRAGQPPAQPGTLGFLDTVFGQPQQLCVQMPQAESPTPLPTRDMVRLFADLESGHADRVDEASRQAASLVDELKGKGFAFFDKRGEDEIKSRSGAALALQLPDHKLMMRSPDGHRKTRVSLQGLENVAAMVNGKPEAMLGRLRRAVERADQLRAAGFAVKMKDIQAPNDDKWIDCNNAELVATLEGGRRVALIDPSGGHDDGVGANRFVHAADAALQIPQAMNDEQRQAVESLAQLMNQQHVAVWTPGDDGQPRRLDSAHAVPFLLARHSDIEVNTPSQFSQQPKAQLKNWSVPIRSWDDMVGFTRRETQPDQAQGVLAQMLGLRGKGVQFYYVTPPATAEGKRLKNQDLAIALNSAFASRLDTEGVKVKLPRRVLWKWLPRKTFTIQGSDELARLAGKF